MLSLLHVAAQATPLDEPTLRPGLDPASVTPGLLGFLATLFVVVLVILLIRDMVKRVRRVRYAAEAEQNRAQRPGGSGPGTADGGRRSGSGNSPSGPQDPTATIHRPPGGTHGPDNR